MGIVNFLFRLARLSANTKAVAARRDPKHITRRARAKAVFALVTMLLGVTLLGLACDDEASKTNESPTATTGISPTLPTDTPPPAPTDTQPPPPATNTPVPEPPVAGFGPGDFAGNGKVTGIIAGLIGAGIAWLVLGGAGVSMLLRRRYTSIHEFVPRMRRRR